jgi:AcrR family transcriptional regulator
VTVKPPQQKRSRASLERVLVASIELLEERGFDGFTVAEVSKRAGVSVGAIYARFENKEALLRAVHRRAMVEIREAGDELAELRPRAGAPAQELVLEAVRGIADISRRFENRLRPFMHMAAVDTEVERVGSQTSIAACHAFTTAVLHDRDAIAHADPELAADIAFRMAYSVFSRRVMYGPLFESDRMIDWDQLAAEVGAACAAYLLGPNPNLTSD